jgi:hypothetical protein
VESDACATMKNVGAPLANLNGWRWNDDDSGQECRVGTIEDHSPWCGLNFQCCDSALRPTGPSAAIGTTPEVFKCLRIATDARYDPSGRPSQAGG